MPVARRFYLPALLMSALVAIVSFFLLINTTTSDYRADVIAHYGLKQRMSTLSIGVLAGRLVALPDGAEREATRAQIRQTMTDLDSGRQDMMADLAAGGIPQEYVGTVQEVNQDVTRFLSTSAELLNVASPSVNTPAYHTIANMVFPIRDNLSALIEKPGAHSALGLEFALLISALASVAVQWVLIFIPMERHIRRDQQQMREEIARREKTAEALRASEANFRLITDNMHDIVVLNDGQGCITFINSACRTILGIEPEVLIGTPGLSLILPDDRERVTEAAIRSIDMKGRTYTIEARAVKSSGEVIWGEIVGTVVLDDQGNRVGSVSVTRDITERRRLQELTLEKERLSAALEKENELGRLRTRMMERIMHEFRTPLTVIQAATETMISYLDRMTPEQRADKARQIKSRIRRITDMLDEIQVVVNGRLVPEKLFKTPTNLSALVRDIAQELDTQTDLAGRFVLDLPETLIVTVDASTLRNGIFHVMRNALQFSEPTDPVQVKLTQIDGEVELTVSDNGIGIPLKDQPRIFDTFYRGTNLNERGGLGLGLAITRAAFEVNGGKIVVESAPAKGTTIKMRLKAQANPTN